jgi:hypothetical protein
VRHQVLDQRRPGHLDLSREFRFPRALEANEGESPLVVLVLRDRPIAGQAIALAHSPTSGASAITARNHTS